MRRRNQAIACPHLCHCCFGKTISLSQEKDEGNINLYDRCGEFRMFFSKIDRVLCYLIIIDLVFMKPDWRSTLIIMLTFQNRHKNCLTDELKPRAFTNLNKC